MRSSSTFDTALVFDGALCSGKSPLFGTTYKSRTGVLLPKREISAKSHKTGLVLLPLQRIFRLRQGSHARTVEVLRFCLEDALALLCSPLAWLVVSNVWNMMAVESGCTKKHLLWITAAKSKHWDKARSAQLQWIARGCFPAGGAKSAC
jgi:hypothetical protein